MYKFHVELWLRVWDSLGGWHKSLLFKASKLLGRSLFDPSVGNPRL